MGDNNKIAKNIEKKLLAQSIVVWSELVLQTKDHSILKNETMIIFFS